MSVSDRTAASADIPRTVVFTGGAEEIGAAIARRFAADGFAVHVCDVREDAIRCIEAECADIRGTFADIGDPGDVARLFEDAVARMGSVGVLLNNVGVGGPRALIEDIVLEDWVGTFRINVMGTRQCMQAVIPQMKDRRAGAITNISTASPVPSFPPDRCTSHGNTRSTD